MSESALRPCVIIPAYNAHATIGQIVRRLKAISMDVLVVSDGSTDRTACDAIEAGAVVLSHLHNEGKGAALRLGFAYALEHGYDAIVTLDSDGQHDPDDVPKLLSAARQAPHAVIVGQRLPATQLPGSLRPWANHLMSFLVSTVTCRAIPDAQCGFRVIRRQVLSAARLSSRRFDIETEVLLAAARQGWQVASVPIRTGTPGASRIHPLADGLRFLGVLLRYVLRRPPRRLSSQGVG